MRTLLAAMALVPALAWADPAKQAEYAAEQILVEEGVLNVYFTANDEGRLTVLFGRQIADWQIQAVLKRLEADPAIRGITHAKVETDYCPIR
jgi:hypothetical protein